MNAPDKLSTPIRSPRKVAIASLMGTMIEWYDFFIYSTAAALVFNVLFFPSFSPATGTLLAFSTFTAGFVARPIGAVIFGHFGDRIGRKSMMVLTILIMGVATVLIGLLPTYETIGIFAPVLLVILRLVQGFALGGEWGGAALMATEHAPQSRRGFFGSFTQAGLTVGLVLAMSVFLPLNALPNDQFMAWGWRVPFLLSSIFVITGVIIRAQVAESPEFERVKNVQAVSRLPIIEVLRTAPKQVLLVAGSTMSSGILFYLIAVYNLVYAGQGSLTRVFMQSLIIVTSVMGFAVILIVGALSDRFGKRRLYIIGLALISVVAFPLYWALGTGSTGLVIVLYVVATIALYIPYAIQPAYFAEAFEPRVRYSGMSLGITLGHLVGSAIAPLVAGALVLATGTSFAISAYVLVATVISFISVCLLRTSSQEKKDNALATERQGDSAAALHSD